MAMMDVLPRFRRSESPPEPDAPSDDPPTPPPPEQSHKGILHIGGMYPIKWDTADNVSVTRARETFEQAIRSGYMGQSYKQTKNPWGSSGLGYAGEVTRTFDPQADEIRMSLPYAGG